MTLKCLIIIFGIVLLLVVIGIVMKLYTRRQLDDVDGLGEVHSKEENHILKL